VSSSPSPSARGREGGQLGRWLDRGVPRPSRLLGAGRRIGFGDQADPLPAAPSSLGDWTLTVVVFAMGDTVHTLRTTNHLAKGLAGTRWTLDPSRSTAEFRVAQVWGLSTVKGHFDRLDGRLEIDHDGRGRAELRIDAASLDTGNRRRDKQLRSASHFDTEHHPDVRFRATSVSVTDDDGIRVAGELEVAARRVPLVLEPTVRHTDDQLDIEATTTIDARELGMTWSPLGTPKTPATLTIHARLDRSVPPAGTDAPSG
jgi:polyisoprenoid-binding protein YceI